MTDPYTALRQALEALEKSEPRRLYACTCQSLKHWPNCHWLRHQGAIAAARAALAAQPEPVAWVATKPAGYNAVGYDCAVLNKLRHGTKLYAAPPQRQPLTDERADEICRAFDVTPDAWRPLIRAVERAHGIGSP